MLILNKTPEIKKHPTLGGFYCFSGTNSTVHSGSGHYLQKDGSWCWYQKDSLFDSMESAENTLKFAQPVPQFVCLFPGCKCQTK